MIVTGTERQGSSEWGENGRGKGTALVVSMKFNVSFRHWYGHIGHRQKPGFS